MSQENVDGWFRTSDLSRVKRAAITGLAPEKTRKAARPGCAVSRSSRRGYARISGSWSGFGHQNVTGAHSGPPLPESWKRVAARWLALRGVHPGETVLERPDQLRLGGGAVVVGRRCDRTRL